MIEVRDQGTGGDGTADDTSVIQAAVDAGSPAVLPPGVYRVTRAIDLVQPRVGATRKG